MVNRLWLCLALAGCADDAAPLTELVLVADSDLSLDRVIFEVSADGQAPRSAEAVTLPASVTLLRDKGPLGPLTLTARGMQQGRELLRRSHVVSFVPDQARVVPLHLYASCTSTSCSADRTCGESGCTPRALSAEQLPRWSGELPRAMPVDASVGSDAAVATDAAIVGDAGLASDAAMPPPMPGMMMCAPQIDLMTDAKNCGMCGRACKAMESCELGMCRKK